MTTKAKRWAWHEAAATDAKVSDSIARTVMILVGFANEETGLMSAAEATIAAKRRLSVKQVSRHLEKLVDLKYLKVAHKGGGTKWIKQGTGMVQVGRATEYTITLPGHSACPSTADLLGHSEGATRTFQTPYSDTLDVRGTILEPSSNHLEGSADAEMGMEGKKDHPSMPVADFKLQLLWGDLWPKAPEVIEPPSPVANDGWISSRLIDLSFKVLGFVPQAPRTASENAAWATISGHLKSMDLAALESRYRAGTLNTADIASTLASAGIVPPAIDAGVEIAQAS